MTTSNDFGAFTPPSPGAWELETTHLQRPLSRYMAAVFPAAMKRGFEEGAEHYGLLLDSIDLAPINRFLYLCVRPIGAPRNKPSKGAPPKWLLRLVCALHPKMRRRIARSGYAMRERIWREDVAQWDAAIKPGIATRLRALMRVDPSLLDTPTLVAHLREQEASLAESIRTHHRFNLVAMLPTGDYLAQTAAWTGLSPQEILPTLAGHSPASIGAGDELAALVQIVRANADLTAFVRSEAPPGDMIGGLRSMPGAIGAAAEAYLQIVGWRIASGFDLCEPSGWEVPEVLLGAIRGALDGTAQRDVRADCDLHAARIRPKVPTEHQGAFDALLAEARFTYRIRDERGYLNDAWAAGVARRPLLEAGRRLVERGRIERANQVFEFTPSELYSVLEGGPGPSREEIAAHETFRVTHTVADAPAHVGFPPSTPPSADILPRNAARLMRAMAMLAETAPHAPERRHETATVKGLGASPGVYEGRACLVLDAAHFADVQRGDVLIVRSTSPSYNVVLPMIGGIVTDRGGLLSHAAIVAREYGLPSVVGTRDGTQRLRDGMRVRVDGSSGTVHIL